MIEGGITPILTIEEISELGYQYVGFPLSGLFSVSWALRNVFTELKHKGTTTENVSQMDQFDEFVRIVELEKIYDLEQKYSF